MKIEIILPDEAIAGTLTYLSVENGEGFLNNVVLNDLEDGNLYTINDTKMDQDTAEDCEPDVRLGDDGLAGSGSGRHRPGSRHERGAGQGHKHYRVSRTA